MSSKRERYIDRDGHHHWHPTDNAASEFIHPVELIEPAAAAEEEIDTTELGKVPIGALSAFLRFIIPRDDKTDRSRWDTAALRVAVLARVILPEIRELSQAQLAEELGVTSAAVCKAVVALRDFASLDCHGGHLKSTRAIYAQRSRECWQRKKQESSCE